MKRIALWTGLLLVGLLAACLPAPVGVVNQPQLVSNDAGGSTSAEGLPQGAYGNCANSGQLSIVYIKDGDIWLWVDGVGRSQLTHQGDAREVRISEDGCRVAYAREVSNPNYDPEEEDEYEQRLKTLDELWMVFSDGTGQQQLASAEQFPRPHILRETNGVRDWQVQEDGFMDTTLSSFEWQPGALKLAFSTASAFNGPGPFPHQDIYLVDTETLAVSTLLPVGRGGRFVFSPDGKQLAFANIDRAGLLNADGTDLNDNLFVFPWIVLGPHRAYQPLLNWTPVGDLIFVLPPAEMFTEPRLDTALWYLPLDGAPAFEAGGIQALDWIIQEVAFSPDRGQLAYLRPAGESQLYQAPPRELVIALSNGSQESASFNHPGILFGAWAPDNQRFIYSYDEDGLRFMISDLHGSLNLPIDMSHLPQVYQVELNWVAEDAIAASLSLAGGAELYLIRPNQGVELMDTLGSTVVLTVDAAD